MAGDWMKIELELPDKPEIHAIAGILQIDSDAVVGKLIRVWQWFDKHTEDGNAYGVTYSLLDRITSVTGFAEAMVFVGWLEQKDKYLCMPKFDRHTSQSAKKRATTQKRVAKSRNAESVTKVLPEKRREEKIIKHRETPIPDDFSISSNVIKWAGEKGHSDLHLHLEHFKGVCKAKGYKYIDWDSAFMNAVRSNWANIVPKKKLQVAL